MRIATFTLAACILQGFASAAAGLLPPALADAGIVEHLNAAADPATALVDENGNRVTLKDYLSQGKPILLNFAYFHCPMLCGLVQQGMVQGLQKLPWVPGKQYEILTISMDWREGPKEATTVKQNRVAAWGKPEVGSGWHFLTGERRAVKSLANTVGFQYNYLPDKQEFAHGAGIIFLTPAGTVSRYLYGVEFSPRDLRLALLDASEGRALSIGDKIEMFCYHYDPNAKGYVLFARNVMTAGGVLVLILMALLLIPLWRREIIQHKSLPMAGVK